MFRLILNLTICLVLSLTGYLSIAQAKGKKHNKVIPFGIGKAILKEVHRNRIPIPHGRLRQAVAVPAGVWQSLADENGTGTTICNDSEAGHYSCLALRCGKDRGLEFAYLFAGGDIEDSMQVPVSVDGQLIETLAFNAVDVNAEMVAPYSPSRHGFLIDALKSGKSVTLQLAKPNIFSLRNSSREIKRVLRQCAGEIKFEEPDIARTSEENPNQVATKSENIELLYNTDIPGNDYTSGLTDPQLANLSYTQCQTQCIADEQCKAFTHNGQNNICILKSDVGETNLFLGATSGIVTNRKITANSRLAKSRKDDQTTDLFWREDDTQESYVARIRNAAVSYGGECSVEQEVIEGVQKSIEVSLDKTKIRAGETVTVRWSGNTLKQNIPVYLMVATDAPVRFKGKGFYALMPDAIGPFGIETFKEKTRAIVALYGKGALKDGEVKIEGILAGEILLDTAVVSYQRKCKREAVKITNLAPVTVKTGGVPIIDLDDRLASENPDEYMVSANGKRLIAEGKNGTWRLLDAKTLMVIVDGAGKEPRFSPTGRFVGVYGDDKFLLYDSIDGKLLYSDAFGTVEWVNNDSFVGFSFHSWGAFRALNTLQVDLIFSGGDGPRAESGRNLPVFDLENNLAISADNGKSRAVRIDQPNIGIYSDGINWESTKTHFKTKQLASFLTSEFVGHDITSQDKAKTWTHDYDIEFRNANDPNCSNCMEVFKETVKRYHEPTRIAADRLDDLVSDKNSLPEIINIADRVTRSLSKSNGTLHRRLRDFGIDFAIPTSAAFEDEVGPDKYSSWNAPGKFAVEFANKVSEEIVKGVPEVRGMFHSKDKYNQVGFDYVRRYQVAGKPLWLAHLVMHGGNAAFYNSILTFFHPDLPKGEIEPDLYNPDSSIGTECYGSVSYCPTQSALFNDRYLALWSNDARGAVVFDGVDLKNVFKKFDLPRGKLLDKISLSKDSQHVLQQNTDNTFYIHRISDGKTVLEGRIVDDEVIVWTPDLRFDSTTEGAHFVNLKFPGQIGQYTFQQFDSRLKVPGLVQKVLSGKYNPQPIEVGVPPSLEGSLELSAGEILGTVTPNSLGSMRAIHIYQDGILSDRITALESGVAIEIKVARLPGSRWVAVVAVDEEGLVSLPIGRDLGADKNNLPSLRLLAVGIDEYSNDGVADLRFAKADANTLTRSLKTASGKSLDLTAQTVLTNQQASPGSVLAAAEKLVADSKPGEQAVFFFAGHGVKGEDGRYYMATSHTDPTNISGTALSWDKLASVLAKSKARMSIFIDACHSGAAGTDFFATNDEAAAGILKNIPSGLTVFSASKGRELSEENAQIGGGYFTRAVAEVIAGNRKKYDLNKNGSIEVSELYVGVKRQVVKNTEGRQTPWLARNQMIGDFALF